MNVTNDIWFIYLVVILWSR